MKLSEEMTKVVEDLSGKPLNAVIRTNAELVKKLSAFILRVQGFEAISSGPDLSEENESLKAKLETLKADFDSLKTNHAAEIDVVRAELDSLLKEKAEREEKADDLQDNQKRILVALEHPGGSRLRLDEISDRLQLRPDEIIAHLQRLAERGHLSQGFNQWEAPVWGRSMKGNDYVIALRLSGEEEKWKKMEKKPPRGSWP
jgi:predicted nuclease with TOPRIM domain